jgi:organic radical activating enzyme
MNQTHIAAGDRKRHINYVEFYITNVCNFNCAGCNRFNNFNLSGSQKWRDYEKRYNDWRDVIDIGSFTVLGGEPMTNPDYLDWLQSIHELWPSAQGSLLTNGHYLRADNRTLYEAIEKSQGRLRIEIGLHNIDRLDEVLRTVKSWLQGRTTVKRIPENLRDMPGFDDNWRYSYEKIRDQSWPQCDSIDQWQYLPAHIQYECEHTHKLSPAIMSERKNWLLQDEHGVTVLISNENFFSQHGLLIDPITRTTRLHRSDPIQAHSICDFAQNRCYHFIRGKLYKCGPVALWPELLQRFEFDLTQAERDLINAYQPGEPGNLQQLDQFLNLIDEPLEQCRFCPSNKDYVEIKAQHGNKITLKKLARRG